MLQLFSALQPCLPKWPECMDIVKTFKIYFVGYGAYCKYKILRNSTYLVIKVEYYNFCKKTVLTCTSAAYALGCLIASACKFDIIFCKYASLFRFALGTNSGANGFRTYVFFNSQEFSITLRQCDQIVTQ